MAQKPKLSLFEISKIFLNLVVLSTVKRNYASEILLKIYCDRDWSNLMGQPKTTV